jgi:hypothetical protein
MTANFSIAAVRITLNILIVFLNVSTCEKDERHIDGGACIHRSANHNAALFSTGHLIEWTQFNDLALCLN